MSVVCAICVFSSAGDSTKSHVMMEGTSLCVEHYGDVIRRADYVRLYGDDRLALKATIDNLVTGP